MNYLQKKYSVVTAVDLDAGTVTITEYWERTKEPTPLSTMVEINLPTIYPWDVRPGTEKYDTMFTEEMFGVEKCPVKN